VTPSGFIAEPDVPRLGCGPNVEHDVADDAGKPRCPFDGFVECANAHDGEPRDELVLADERPVDHAPFTARELEPHALCARAQAVGGEQLTGLDHVADHRAHARDELLARQAAVLVIRIGLVQHHELHRPLLLQELNERRHKHGGTDVVGLPR
jgi:hypothetical protein